jgi:membrane protein
MKKGEFAGLLFRTFIKWHKQDATLRAAALTFFVILPLPSLALIAIEVLALFYGQEQALEQLIVQVTAFAGPSVANLLRELLLDAQSPLTSLFGSVIAVAFAVSGAMGALSVLQKSINRIWEFKPPKRSRVEFIKEKLFPSALIIGLGIIVLVWTAVSTVLFGVAAFIIDPLFGGLAGFLLRILQIILSFALGTLLFAIVFKSLPEIIIQWKDVWLAAVITGVVFTILNYLFGFYLSLVQITTIAGTAGTLIILFLWIYVTTLFILFGATFSKVYAQSYGSQKFTSKPPPKKLPISELDHVEMKAELNIKVTSNDKKP